MVTRPFKTPGVYINPERVLNDPARVLRTGVPVFFGLIMRADLDACNDRLPEDNRFGVVPLALGSDVGIVRRSSHLRLPPRMYSTAWDRRLGDPSSHLYGLQNLRAGEPMPAPARTAYTPNAAAQSAPASSLPKTVNSPTFSAKPQRFTLWPQFLDTYGDLREYGLLVHAVRGFFENEGDLCYVQVMCFEKPPTYATVTQALATLAPYDEFDLVCAPDLAWLAVKSAATARQAALAAQIPTDEAVTAAKAAALEVAVLQAAVLEHCHTTGDRVAILDSLIGDASLLGKPGNDDDPDQPDAGVQDQRRILTSNNGTLYYPWVRVQGGPAETGGCVPPCGHVAGVYNRCDRQIGVHKAPANELLRGVIELQRMLNNLEQEPLNDIGVNCLRVFARRGIRIWGARTLGNLEEWRYVNVRRVFLTAGRWIERNMRDIVFEPHTPQLWARVERDLTAYFTDLARRGAMLSSPDGGGFYVKCDAETNPPEMREAGCIVTEIGLAAAPPAEFIVVRVIHGPTGVQVESQVEPAA